jgi:hypothetical protein
MRYLTLILTLALAIGACSNKNHTSIGDDFKPYVSQFTALYGLPMPPIDIIYSPLTDASAICHINNKRQATISVDKTRWDKLCENQKRALMFHEFGHCVLGRDHVAEGITYMLPEIQSCAYYDKNFSQLDKELFNPGLVFKPRPLTR